MKALAAILTALMGAALIWATMDFPRWGDPASPASVYLSPHYIEKSLPETSVPNIVTSVLADYRGFDTMFETAVVFTAGVACLVLLRIRRKDSGDPRVFRHIATGVVIEVKDEVEKEPSPEVFQEIDSLWAPYDLITQTVARLLIPFIQLFGLYVIAHGHHSPGGGFQGGVILGASIILLAISFDLRTAKQRVGEAWSGIMSSVGVLIYAGVGAACLGLGFNFLDYQALAPVLGVTPVHARSLGILFVEVGVGLAVMATMILIYKNVASAGSYKEGL